MRRRRSDGFTLLEVVVATAILSVGVAMAMQVFSGGLRNLHRIHLAHRAMAHAENIMSELLSDGELRGPYQSGGELDEDFSYQAAVDYFDDPNPSTMIDAELVNAATGPVYLLSVVVEVHFKNDPNNRLYRVVGMKAVSEDQGPVGSEDALRRIFGRQQ